MKKSCTLTIPEPLYRKLHAHLFPGDGDEHGAVIAAGVVERAGCMRLLARDLFLAEDGVDYVAGKRGYRMLTAEFVHRHAVRCRSEGLAYLAVHNHGGSTSVAFSEDDLASHERGYPALLDIIGGRPVGALVLAPKAVAGDIWLPGGGRLPLSETRVLGAKVARLYPESSRVEGHHAPEYARQILMFGERGQLLLRQAHVGVVGAGGVGSLLVEYLSRLGVGQISIADPDRIEITNLSRVVGATQWDALAPLQAAKWPSVLREWAARHGRYKTSIALRMARKANPRVIVKPIDGRFETEEVSQQFLDCDFLFLAADSMRARLVFNAMCQQYFIPGIQAGSKAMGGGQELDTAFSVTRWITPGAGCMWCADAISRQQLAVESKSGWERQDQAYGTAQPNPSVISLNAMAAAQAANDFLFSYVELFSEGVVAAPRRFKHIQRKVVDEILRPDVHCPECSSSNASRFGRGDGVPLPTVSCS